MSKHTGSCHCGNVRFEVEGEIDGALSCNCSICRRKGALLWFVPRAALKLQTDEAASQAYTFNKHVIKHRFCRTCGIHPYGEGVAPDGTEMAAVNLCCVDEVDLDAVPVTHYDGKAL